MEINILEGNKHINLSLKQWLLAVHIWYMLEGKYQRNGDTKKQRTTINYSMTTTFQLIRGEQMFIFCLLLLSQKAPPPAVWHQRKKWIMQDFSEWTIQIIQLLLKVYFMFYIQNRGKKIHRLYFKRIFLTLSGHTEFQELKKSKFNLEMYTDMYSEWTFQPSLPGIPKKCIWWSCLTQK